MRVLGNTAAVALLLMCQMTCSSGRNILLVSPLGTKSHTNFFGHMVAGLANRGHTVTTVTAYELAEHTNVNQIVLPECRFENHLGNSFSLFEWKPLFNLFKLTTTLCTNTLASPKVQNLNMTEIDLVMMGVYTHECFLSLIDRTEIPLILFVPNSMPSFLGSQMGVVGFPSFVTTKGSRLMYPMTFAGRLKNVLMFSLMQHIMTHLLIPLNERYCKQQGICAPDMTPLGEIQRRASLIFINSVRSLDHPARPYPPSVVPIGGINCRPAVPLPDDLRKWADESGANGFLYFSLGTAVNPADMSEEHLQILLQVFTSLPYRILWKWNDESLEGLPDNIRMEKWLPQQDVLGHPNCRLFISHGGLFGTMEATYHGVPMLGMPVFADQSSNVDQVVDSGWGDIVNWSDLSEDLFRSKIIELVSNPSYRRVVERQSEVMRDQPMPPRDVMVYWTEYVLRHSGAPHLRSPVVDMPIYQLYNMDVWLTIIVTVTVILALFIKLVVTLIRCCCCRGRSTQSLHSNKLKLS